MKQNSNSNIWIFDLTFIFCFLSNYLEVINHSLWIFVEIACISTRIQKRLCHFSYKLWLRFIEVGNLSNFYTLYFSGFDRNGSFMYKTWKKGVHCFQFYLVPRSHKFIKRRLFILFSYFRSILHIWFISYFRNKLYAICFLLKVILFFMTSGLMEYSDNYKIYR